MSYTSDLGEVIAAMRKRTISLAWLAALTGLLALTACDSATSGGMGTVRLQVASIGVSNMLEASAAAGVDGIASAIVTIDRAELMPGHVAVSLSSTEIDLLALDGDVTVGIGSVPTPLGSYEQLRLIVSDIDVFLENGTELEELPARVPSGPQTGIKIDFAEPVAVGPGDVVDLIVAFNVSESFVFQGPPTDPISVLFRPVIHVSTSDEAASIGGQVTVSRPGGGDPVTVDVKVVASAGGTPVDSVIVPVSLDAAAISGTGDYLLRFLQLGEEYTVAAVATGYPNVMVTGTNPVTAVAGLSTGPNFTLAP